MDWEALDEEYDCFFMDKISYFGYAGFRFYFYPDFKSMGVDIAKAVVIDCNVDACKGMLSYTNIDIFPVTEEACQEIKQNQTKSRIPVVEKGTAILGNTKVAIPEIARQVNYMPISEFDPDTTALKHSSREVKEEIWEFTDAAEISDYLGKKFLQDFYVNNPEPDYLKHMDKIHGYDTKASGMYLSDVGTGILEELRKDGNCSDASHGFGLGSVQWTYERCEALIDRYLDKFGNSYFPTKEECTEVEIDYALYELSGPYKDVVIKCEKQTSGMSDSEKVAKITEIVMTDYEIPSVSNLSKRQEAADIWYNILIGGNNGN